MFICLFHYNYFNFKDNMSQLIKNLKRERENRERNPKIKAKK